MDDIPFDEFAKRLAETVHNARVKQTNRAFSLPNILGDEDYIQYLTIEYNYTDRVN